MQNALKSNEQQSIWVHKTFKIEIQKGGPNNSDFQTFSPTFQDSTKSTRE